MLRRLKTSKPLLALSLTLFAGCSGLKVTVCVIDAQGNLLQCSPPGEASYSIPIQQADNYVCLSPDDTQTLLNYLKAKCSK